MPGTTTLLQKCTDFDKAMVAAAARATPKDLDQSRAILRPLVDLLPQRDAIQEQHLERWLDKTLVTSEKTARLEGVTGDQEIVARAHGLAMWHLRRASAIGGSEVGTVVHHYRGEPGTFTDAHNLTMEKLLIMAPQPSTPEMARGVRAEPWIQRMYHENNGTRTDTQSLDKLRGFRWSRIPILLGTPDDMILESNGLRIIDYKAPSAEVMKGYDAKGISFDYVCQLHDYAVLSMAAGVKFKKLSVEAFDPRYFTIQRYNIDFDVDLAREIARTASTLWEENVMQGVIPDAPRPDELDVEDDAVKLLGTQAAILKVIGDQIGDRLKDTRERISMIGSDWHGLSVGKLNLEVASLTRKRTWDEDSLRSLADSVGVDPAEYEKDEDKLDQPMAMKLLKELDVADAATVTRIIAEMRETGLPLMIKLDADALAKRLEVEGVSTLPAATLTESFALSRKQKGPEAEKLAALKLEASEAVDMIENMAERSAPGILNPEVARLAEDAAMMAEDAGMDMDP